MKHFAEYLFPGFLFAEETTRELTKRSVAEGFNNAPEGAYCFTLYDTEEAPDLGSDFNVTAKRKNVSGRFYLGGRVYTLEQVKAMGEEYRILAANMRGNGWERAIRCITGNWQPFTDDDLLITA